jgi:hypothetical protein
MKLKKSFKFKINFESLKYLRFATGFYYFIAGTGVFFVLDSISKDSYLGAAFEALVAILWFYIAGRNRKQLEEKVAQEAEIDGFLEGFKHGLKS